MDIDRSRGADDNEPIGGAADEDGINAATDEFDEDDELEDEEDESAEDAE